MSLKQIIKTKICIVSFKPNYPLLDFVVWAEDLDKNKLLNYLNQIQIELDQEWEKLRHPAKTSRYAELNGYWCFYCEQIRAYYRAIVRNPHRESELVFLLVD